MPVRLWSGWAGHTTSHRVWGDGVTEGQSDRMDRINAVATTLLDSLAMLLVAAGAGWGAWTMWGQGRGLAVAGGVLFLMSLVAQARQAGPKQVKVPPGAHPHPPLPGPEDPGTVHVKGR